MRGYQFMLQETQMLTDEMSLADQCIQSEGLVQIKMMVANGKINIMGTINLACYKRIQSHILMILFYRCIEA